MEEYSPQKMVNNKTGKQLRPSHRGPNKTSNKIVLNLIN